MSTRRSFFKYLGLGAGVAAGGVVAAAAVLPDTEKQNTIKQIQDAGYNGKMMLGATYGKVAPIVPTAKVTRTSSTSGTIEFTSPPHNLIYSPTNFVEGTRKDVQITLTVGPDGNLYLNQNGKWARIVTE